MFKKPFESKGVALRVYFDGAITFNPGGIMNIGWIVQWDKGFRDWATIYEHSGPLETQPRTNNEAEWGSLLSALEWIVLEKTLVDALSIYGDSQVVICGLNRLKGKGGKVKKKNRNERMIAHRNKAGELLKSIPMLNGNWEAIWIKREENSLADGLCHGNGVRSRKG